MSWVEVEHIKPTPHWWDMAKKLMMMRRDINRPGTNGLVGL